MIGWDEKGIYLFSSKDGVNFVKEKNLDLDGRICDAMKMNNLIYLYCYSERNGKPVIFLFKSKDGINWDEYGVVYESDEKIADPTVVFFNGKYYMALTKYK
jgi:hypothetical protein